ncbi:MAG: PAS domain S-box protein [Acidobacteria bacterium]|nr:PAS domain S-box protein [Acidobacteriota bacterium]
MNMQAIPLNNEPDEIDASYRNFGLEAASDELTSAVAEPAIEGLGQTDTNQTLTHSAEWLKTIFEVSRDGILVEDHNGRIVYVNQSYLLILGYDQPQELLGKHISLLTSDEDKERMTEFGRRRVRGELPPSVYEFKGQRKDGTLLNLEASISTSTIAGKTYIITAVRNIAERNQAEAALRAAHDELEARVAERTAELSQINRFLQEQIKERARINEALRQAEQKYHLIFENAVTGIYQTTLDGHYLAANPMLARIIGYDSPAEMMESVKDLYRQFYVEEGRREEFARRVSENGVLTAFESPVYRRDGRVIWISEHALALRDVDDKIVGYQGTTIDITDRKRAEEALQKAHDELEARVAERTIELSQANAYLKQQISKRERAEEALREANQRAIVEYDHLLDRIASFAQTLGTARDLNMIFRALRDFTLASVPSDAILVTLYDQESNTRKVVYGWIDNAELDLSELPLVPVGDGLAGQAIKSGEVLINNEFKKQVEESKVKIPIGTDMDVSASLSALTAPMTVMGRTVGCVEIQSRESDAYESGHATAMRMAANLAANAIENVQLYEREREKEEQLRQSQKMEAVGQLAGGIAHDFNNLLTVITGYSDLMLRGLRLNDPLRQKIEQVKKAGERAASLTRQLLAFSRKQVLQPKVLALNEVVADMDKMLRRLIGEDIDLMTILEPSLWQVKADPGQIEQVIMNLGVNAHDAMPKGGKLTIQTENIVIDETYAARHMTVKPGRYVMLAVSDTGTGMDTTTQKRIFEPFYTTKDQGKGTGLGLSTVYGIVKQSNGSIWVYSEVGLGTAFKIYLPQFADEVTESAPRALAIEASQGTETVLLVEDDETVRELARETLEMSGYHVLTAANGDAALSCCEHYEGQIHLILTDVVMPQMSGRELAERLTVLYPETPVLYMSGYTDDAIVHHGILEEGVAFLEKPFTPNILTHKVRTVLDGRDSETRRTTLRR